MVEAAYDTMGAVLARWTMGAPAAPAATAWSAELGTDPGEAELRLLALSGQFLGVAVTVEPLAGLRTLPDIPVLALPSQPEALRPLLRRMLASTKDAQFRAELLDFLAGRGWTAHPGDFLPAANDEDLPDEYAPWRDWADAAAAAGTARKGERDELGAGNWDDFWPAARKAALAALRKRDPAAARAVMEAKLAGEGAEARLRLLGLVAVRLSDADIPFLEAIAAGDRAPKVKALATSLLARLGRGPAAGEEAAELAGFFSVRMKGILRRSRVIEPNELKTSAQRLRRSALFEGVDIAAFAAALAVQPDELVTGWSWGADGQADIALATLVAGTGTDALAALAAETIAASEGAAVHGLAVLAPRLAPDKRTALAAMMLRARGCSFDTVRAIAGPAGRLDQPFASAAGNALLQVLGREDAKASDGSLELHALGLIASRDGARRALERMDDAGLLAGDPRLDMLRLNAALNDSGAKS
jgi:hypothetical protein